MSKEILIVYRNPLIGEAYRRDNYIFCRVINKLTIRRPVWTYISLFERSRDIHGAWKAPKGHFEGKIYTIRTKGGAYQVIDAA